MPSREDLTRIQESAASAAQARIENQTNKLIAQAQITLIDQAINALPPPVNVGAKALGQGIFIAFKTPVKAVSNPTQDQDPVKLMAFAIAFAILKAIWCFIKSILNPLPIIGFFFPLCSDDPQLQISDLDRVLTDVRPTEAAKAKAESDPSNIAAIGAVTAFNNATSVTSAANEAAKAREEIARQGNDISATVSSQSSDMNNGAEGMTFEEFVAKTVVAASIPTVGAEGPSTALMGQINQNQTSANIPDQPTTVEPEWQPKDKLTEGASYEAYRRLFGL